MAGVIKYSTTTPTNQSTLRKGNTVVAVGNDATSQFRANGFSSGIDIPLGGYVVYTIGLNNNPKVWVANTDSDLIPIARTLGGNPATAADAKYYICSVTDAWILDNPLNNIVTDGLVLKLDAGNLSSYPEINTSFMDLSGEGNDGTLTNGPTFGPNGSITLDGVDDYINQSSFYTSDHFTNNQSFTIDSLINVLSSESAGNTRGGILTNQLYSSQNDPGGFGLNIVSQKYCINLTSGSTGNAVTYQSIAATSINYGEIERITAVYDSPSSTVKIYRNGVLTTTQTSTSYKWTPRSTGAAQKIGTSTQGGWTYYFPMDLYNILLYNKALTSTEILQNYYQGPTITDGLALAVDAGNLVSYESGSTTTYSLTGSNTGTLTNGVGFSGDNGGAFTFDGTDDYISFDTTLTFSSANLTSVAWVKLDSYLSQNSTIGFSPDSGTAGFRIYAISATSLGVWTRNGTGGVTSITTNNGIPLNEWVQVTFVLNGTNGIIYKNGVAILNGTFTQTPNALSSSPVWLSRYSGGGYVLDGKTASALLYNRALTAGEVTQNYNAQIPRFQ
jgi:hypothetical protein